MSRTVPETAERLGRIYHGALLAIISKTGGCERLVWPSECRGRTGYPREEWCVGCIAADAIGLAPAIPSEKVVA